MGFKDALHKGLNLIGLGATNKALNLNNLSPKLFAPTIITNGQPVWRNLSELSYLIECYHENPVVNAVFNIRADAKANVRYFVRDLKTLEETPLSQYTKDGGKLKQLLTKPNPLQSGREKIKQNSVNFDVFGNSYTYATTPAGFSKDYKNITSLKNLAPYCVAPVLTGKFLEATEISEIITKYEFTINGRVNPIDVDKVLHMNNVNIILDETFTQGRSKLIALQRPISNIDMAFEARNVLGTKKGALGIISPEAKNEELGSLPFQPEQIEQIQEAEKKYGLRNNQDHYMISPAPMKFTKIAMNVKELGLFEEVSHSSMPICYSYGVPVGLVKNWIQTGTLGTDSDEEQKRMYSDSIIPQTEDDTEAVNEFLNLREHGIELVASFDHLKFLQADKKKEAETNKTKTETAEKKFFTGLTTYGQYAIACDVELYSKALENKYFFELEPEIQAAISPKAKTTQTPVEA